MNSNSSLMKIVAGLAVLVLLGAIALRFAVRPDAQEAQPAGEISKFVRDSTPPTERVLAIAQGSRPSESGDENSEEHSLAVPREKADEFLAKHNRSAASLLAGYRALQDTNLLVEAAAKFPNDPQVQLAMLNSQILPPAQRRQWLDAFKASSPDNSLANYLSAAEHFNSGNSEAAIKELTEASGKKPFKDYTMESMIDEQELRRFAGQNAFMAMHGNGWGADLLAQLSPMKQVANGIHEAQSKYAQSGDKASADNLIQIGLGLAGRLDSGEGGRFMLSQMVGEGVEKKMLQQLEQDTAYESLGGKTPKQRIEEMNQQKAERRKLMTALSSAYGKLSEDELMTYSDRMKAQGELEALRWLQQRVDAAK